MLVCPINPAPAAPAASTGSNGLFAGPYSMGKPATLTLAPPPPCPLLLITKGAFPISTRSLARSASELAVSPPLAGVCTPF